MTVLVLGEEFRALPKIALLDAEFVHVRAAPGRAEKALAIDDFTFAYWRAPFALSSAAPVVLGYDVAAGRYVADPELMRAPVPPPDALEKKRGAAHAAHAEELGRRSDTVPSELTQPILDLVYTGHLDAARDFLEKAWAGSTKTREAYWSDLTGCELRLSPFWPAVAKLNGLAAAKPAGKCPKPRHE